MCQVILFTNNGERLRLAQNTSAYITLCDISKYKILNLPEAKISTALNKNVVNNPFIHDKYSYIYIYIYI